VTAEMYQFPDEQPEKNFTFIELSPRDVQDAARLLKLLLKSRPPAQQTRKLPIPSNKDELIRLASKMLYARRLRTRLFNPDMFGESAWDFLLALYMTDERGPRLTIGRLRELADVPSSSAARWLDSLESQQLVMRESHHTDARTFFVQLTDKGRELMEVYLSETLTAG
jgi:DNA-binding MarR family transcriptional regulator